MRCYFLSSCDETNGSEQETLTFSNRDFENSKYYTVDIQRNEVIVSRKHKTVRSAKYLGGIELAKVYRSGCAEAAGRTHVSNAHRKEKKMNILET